MEIDSERMELYKKSANAIAAFFKTVSSSDEPNIARIARNHLIVEYYLAQYLIAADLIVQGSNTRKDYADKVNLATQKGSYVEPLRAGLNALGEIRNHYVHNLTYTPRAHLLLIMRNGVEQSFEKLRNVFEPHDRDIAKDEKIIDQFAMVACVELSVHGNLMLQGHLQKPRK